MIRGRPADLQSVQGRRMEEGIATMTVVVGTEEEPGQQRCGWSQQKMVPWLGRGTAFGRAHLNGGNNFYRECRENTWALRRRLLCCPLVAAVPPPLFTSDKREASLVGGNHRMQKCDSVDPLSLVIKCLGGGGVQVGGLGSPDYRQITLSLWRPSQHTHTSAFNETFVDLMTRL